MKPKIVYSKFKGSQFIEAKTRCAKPPFTNAPSEKQRKVMDEFNSVKWVLYYNPLDHKNCWSFKNNDEIYFLNDFAELCQWDIVKNKLVKIDDAELLFKLIKLDKFK